jgi:hypothetical protein
MKTFNFRDDNETLRQYLQTLDEYDSLTFKFIGDKILIFSRANTYQVMSFAYVILDFDFETAEIPDHSESHIKLWSKASHVIMSVTTYSNSIRLRDFDATDREKVVANLSFFGRDMSLTLFPVSDMYELAIEDEEIVGDAEQIVKVLSELERKYGND